MSDHKILIVEDEESVALNISDMLQQFGYQVAAVAGSGEEALKKIAETGPDLVLMDILLKGSMDGVETTDQIRRCFDIPVVYVTGSADKRTLQRAKVTDPLGFVVKPFKPKDLHSSIEVALHIHELGKKLRESEARLRIDNEKRKRVEEALTTAHNELTSVHKQLRRDYELASKVFSNVVKTDYLVRKDVNYFMISQDIACGDLVLISPKAPDGLYAFVGDFTGHGLSAAIGAIPASDIFYAMTAKNRSVSDMVAAINTKLKATLPTGLFCCACMIELDHARDKLIVWNGGMPDVLMVGKQGGIKNRLPFCHPALGVVGNDELGLDVEEVEIAHGDRVYICSDGVIETADPDGEEFGQRRLEKHFSYGYDAENALDNIRKSLEAFCKNAPRSDDITMMEVTWIVDC